VYDVQWIDEKMRRDEAHAYFPYRYVYLEHYGSWSSLSSLICFFFAWN
jgi:hypothetical protein